LPYAEVGVHATGSEGKHLPKGRQLDGYWKIPNNPQPTERVCFCINLPDDPEHFAIFWGMFELLTRPMAWDNPNVATRDGMAAYYRQIFADNRACFEEVLAMANRGCGGDIPTNQRILENGIIEVSYDGGDTYEPLPDDPRWTDPVFPPITGAPGEDIACSGANSLVAVIREATIQVTANEGLWAAINTLIGIITGLIAWLVPGIGPIIAPIIGALAALLLNLGRQALIDGMTETVYDQLLCIFYCHILPDASFDQAGWLASAEEVHSEIADPASNIWISIMLRALGPVGMTNAARVLPTAADCSSCGCEPCSINQIWQYNYETEQWFKPQPESETTIVLTSTTGSAREVITIAFNQPYPTGDCCNIVSWEQISGNQIFIVDEINCADEQTSGALPPGGCWKQITIYSQLNPEPRQVWRMTLGDECV